MLPPPGNKPASAPVNIKLLLIGNSSVGKSSLLLRFSDETWLPEDEASATIGVDFRVHRLTLPHPTTGTPTPIKLSIWDTAGQERFKAVTASYYRGAQGVVLVYDVASKESFEGLPRWWRELETYAGDKDGVVKIVVGNKVDKEFSREVSTEDGQAFATRMGCLFVESSAKTSIGVKEAFTEVVQKILENITKDTSMAGTGAGFRTDHGRGGVPGGVQVVGVDERTHGGGGGDGGCSC